MPELMKSVIGSLVRFALTSVFGWLVAKGAITEGQAGELLLAIAAGAAALGWSLYQKYKDKLKFFTALEVSTPLQVERQIANADTGENLTKAFQKVGVILLCVLLAAGPASAQTAAPEKQTTVVISFETSDASQFGYKPWDKGLRVALAREFGDRWEGTISGGFSDAAKAYIGEGNHADGGIGVRFYFNPSVFATAGATVGFDTNPDYKKFAVRGFVGIGGKLYGFVGTLTAFSPPSDLSIDPNQVKGLNLTIEYFRPIAGRLGAYAGFQGSLASFNQSGGDPADRFTAAIWKGRAGIYITF